MTANKATPEQKVLRKFPGAYLEKQTDPHRQPWFLWRDRTGRQLTDDLLGCGGSPQEAYKDAMEKV